MGALDYLIIGIVAVWFAAALRSILRRKGGCSCGCGTSGPLPCGKGCAHSKGKQSDCSGCAELKQGKQSACGGCAELEQGKQSDCSGCAECETGKRGSYDGD